MLDIGSTVPYVRWIVTSKVSTKAGAAVGLCAVLSVVLLTLIFPSSGLGYVVEPVVEQNISTVSQHVARGGAVGVPGVSCGTACADLYSLERAGTSASPQLHRELRTVRSAGARVLPPLRSLGTIGLAVGAFDLGWKIGTGINAKLLKIGVPPNGEIPASYSRPIIEFRSAGQRSQLWYKVPIPEDGWVWSIYSSALPCMGSCTCVGA